MLAAVAAVVVVGAAGVALVAGRDRDELGIPPEAVDSDALSGPGSPLGDGLVVAEGSALIGLPIPGGRAGLAIGSAGSGFSAYLFIDGEPGQVVDEYLAQAAANGFQPLLAPNDGDGFEAGPIPAERNRVGRCGLELSQEPSFAPSYVCAATAENAQGRCFDVSILRNERYSHGFVRLYEPTAPPGTCLPSSITGDLDEPAPAMPTEWAVRPPVGTELGGRFGSLAAVPVQPGSHLAGAPAAGADHVFCAAVAALRVTGDPKVVLERYVTDVRAVLPLEGLEWRSANVSVGGVSLEERSVVVPAGGDTYVLDLVTSEDGTAFLYAYTCAG
ncbi:MAG: hypothetical protein ACRDYW_07215 [Acidimicrobiales bacterium]